MVRGWLLVGCLVLGTLETRGQTSYPMLLSLKPVALQVGTSVECDVRAYHNLRGCHQVFVSGAGVVGEVVPIPAPELKPGEKAPALNQIKLKFTVGSDAALGPREFRLASPFGASTIGQLVVVRDPVIVEPAENDTPDKAPAVTFPATLCGTIEKGEDFDFWKFTTLPGQSLVFHVRSQRLQNKIHDLQTHSDPILFLRDAAGSVVAMSDNHYFGDPFLTHTFPQGGEFLLELRDVRYQGNVDWIYAVEVHGRPFVDQVVPFAVAPGVETTFQLSGVQLGAVTTAILATPAELGGPRWVTLPHQGELTNPVPLYVTDQPLAAEPEGDNDTLATAAAISTPVVVNGRIEKEADLDLYAFEAKAGQALTIEVLGRRYASRLDPYVRILNAEGQPLREDDDAYHGKLHHADTLIDGWAPPADGKYFLELRDVHLRGGAGFGYALRIVSARPQFELQIDTDKTNLTPGTHGVVFVRAIRRHGFTGEIALSVEGLPAGVSATTGRILAGKGQDGAIILSAAADAPLAMSRLTIRGTATHPLGEGQPPWELTATAQPYQEIYMPGGGRSHYVADDHVVCVGSPSDIRAITLDATEIRLKPGESKRILVKIERSPEVQANISLDFLFQHLGQIFANTLPEGVTIDAGQSQTLLASGATEGYITLKADPQAPAVERQLCALMANFSINFVMKATYGSPPVYITVTPP
jgi:hypothetical protein